MNIKINLDKTNKTNVSVGKTKFNELPIEKQNLVISALRQFLNENSEMSDYETDSMYMAYRYAIGRHSIGAHSLAGEIGKNCYGRMSEDRSEFTAFDINRSIEDCLHFSNLGLQFGFPLTQYNTYKVSAIDAYCEFCQEYGINTVNDLKKYKTIDVVYDDSDKGWHFNITTWDEYKKMMVRDIVRNHCQNLNLSDEYCDNEYESWILLEKTGLNSEVKMKNLFGDEFKKLRDMIPTEIDDWSFVMMSIDDLFVWNDLSHLFDVKSHHKSVLSDDSEVEWFWTWAKEYGKNQEIQYRKIRVPVDRWNGIVTTWIPDENVKKDIY